MQRVLLVYKSIPAYRQTFYEDFRSALRDRGVELLIAQGDPVGPDQSKGDAIRLEGAVVRKNRVFRVGRTNLVWQPIQDLAQQSDLVIVEQASKLIVNYLLLARQKWFGGTKVALWGHGTNLQLNEAHPVGEWLKRRYSAAAHWWFAYTDGSRDRVVSMGFPVERVTVVQNAIDTAGLAAELASVSDAALDAFRNEHGCQPGATGLFVGSLYGNKRLQFLFDAAEKVYQQIPNFVLLVGGDGPDRDIVQSSASRLPFVHYLGRVDGPAYHLALRAADFIVMPGAVGLAILDAFVADAPLITTDVATHGPEIEYLRDGENGIMVRDPEDVDAYAAAIVSIIGEAECAARLHAGCRADATKYTNEEMVRRFSDGVLRALQT